MEKILQQIISSRLFVIDRLLEHFKKYASLTPQEGELMVEKQELERQLKLLGDGGNLNYHITFEEYKL